jgi:transcriptional regulator with XRE-family HTH domain
VEPQDPEQLLVDVGRKIAEIRKGRGQTQAEVSERLGIATRSYQQIELGKQNLTLKTMVKIANLLEVPMSQLLETPSTREIKLGRPRKERSGSGPA